MHAEERAALEAEHGRLAERLAIRRSIDDVRKAAYGGFACFVGWGVAAKLAWDRWGWGPTHVKPVGRYPLFFLAALLLALVLTALTWRWYARARRIMRVEDVDFARLKELRRLLELEP